MALLLKANTAVDVLIGPFVDGANGKDTEEAETPVVLLSKNGQALAAKNDVTVPVHDNAGYYNCELDATDLNTEGTLVLVVEDSATALGVRHEYNVLCEAAYDSMFAVKDTGFMDVNIKTIGRTDAQETEANNLETICASSNGSALTEAGGTGDHLTAVPLHADWQNGGRLDLILDIIAADTTTDIPALIAATEAKIDTIDGIVDNILADTNELQTDWANGGRLDLILDIIAADTTTDIPALIAAAEAKIDTIDGIVDNILVDTNELQTDWANGGRLDLILDIIAADTTTDIPATITTMQGNVTDILADTNELQTDWANGGRLDLLIDAILADTGELQTDWADGGRLDLLIDAILADTNELQTDDYPTSIAALQTDLDTLTDAAGEPGQGAPPVSASLVDKIAYLYKFMRNKIMTDATTIEVYDDAGAVVDHKATISDDGTDFTRGEFGTGP